MYEDRLARMIDEALEEEMSRIRERIREAADRILEQRLAEMGVRDEDLIDRYQAAEEFELPVWKIRDLQLNGKLGPTVRRGKKAYVHRSALVDFLGENGAR